VIDGKRVLAVIPARGGSKGLPRKNLRLINGKPLIAWTISQALASRNVEMVVVSTDDEEISEIARSCGAHVPCLRPAELARDDSPTIDAVLHMIDYLDESFDACCVLEPTSPLRRTYDIDKSIDILNSEWDTTDALVTIGEVHLESPFICKKISAEGYLQPIKEIGKFYQRQQLPKSYFPYGVFYGVKVQTLLLERSFYPLRTRFLLLERWQNFEIDDELDLLIVETIMKRYMLL
jgi:CMP-N,N'-diacetyllegionaminic acid synthase